MAYITQDSAWRSGPYRVFVLLPTLILNVNIERLNGLFWSYMDTEEICCDGLICNIIL